MADWQEEARKAALRYGVDPYIFQRQMGQEAHGQDLTSGAGAQGPAQFMPGTARSVGLTPTTVHQIGPAYNAAAKLVAGYVKKYGSYRNALIAYNAGPGRVGGSLPAETQHYIDVILNGRDPGHLGQPSASPPSSSSPSASPVQALTGGDPGGGADASALISLLQSQQQPQRPVASASSLPAPSFMAGPSLPAGYKALSSGGGGPAPKQDIGQLLALVQTQGQTSGAAAPVSDAGAPVAPSGGSGGDSGGKGMPKGTASFENSTVAAWIAPILEYARAHGWKGTINSGFRSFEDQKRIYASGVRPAAKPGTSNHEGSDWPRGAVDVSEAEQLNQILQNSPYRKRLVWAGSKDPVHFSHPHNGSY